MILTNEELANVTFMAWKQKHIAEKTLRKYRTGSENQDRPYINRVKGAQHLYAKLLRELEKRRNVDLDVKNEAYRPSIFWDEEIPGLYGAYE